MQAYKQDATLCIFLLLINLFVFQSGLADVIQPFQFLDELYAAGAVFFYCIYFKRKIRFNKNNLAHQLILLLFLYVIVGLISSIICQYQPVSVVLEDIFLNLKFFLGIATSIYLFKSFDFRRYNKIIKYNVKLLLIILSILVLVNKIFHIFKVANERFGISSEQLFFHHPTHFAAAAFFLMTLMLILYERGKHEWLYIIISVFLMLSTLRFKAIAAAVVFIYIYYIVNIKNWKLSYKKLLFLVPAMIIIGGEEFYFYFFSDSSMETARGALTIASIWIAADNFPFGSGFGTFASAPSGKYYSVVYGLYHIDGVWGLEYDHSSFISDVFWPMILGQTGVIGLLIYILILRKLFLLVCHTYEIDKMCYISGLGVLIYLLFSSVAESAFVNPISVPLSLVLGLSLCKVKKMETVRKERA